MSNKPVKARGSGIRVFDGVLVVAAGVIGIVVAFAVLHVVAGLIWEVVKIAVVVGLIGAALWFVARRRR